MAKIYTAQEMREVTYRERFECSFITRTLNGGIIHNCTSDVSSMLHQAAEMREMLDALIAKAKKENETQTSFGCRTCVENYVKEINYILRGDAMKEGKHERKHDR